MAKPRSQEEVVGRFQQLLSERDQLTSASLERQSEMSEHDLVIKTLEPLDGGRKCFRLVGDVLVERTVAEVLPAVKKNRDNLAALVATYEKQLAAKQKEVLAFQQQYNIRIKGEGEGEGSSGAAGGKPDRPAGSGAQGVLVGG